MTEEQQILKYKMETDKVCNFCLMNDYSHFFVGLSIVKGFID